MGTSKNLLDINIFVLTIRLDWLNQSKTQKHMVK